MVNINFACNTPQHDVYH